MKAHIVAWSVVCAGCNALIELPARPDAGKTVNVLPSPDAAADHAAPPVDDAAADSPASSWCATNFPWAVPPRDLCDDFDLPTAPRAEWTVSGAPSVIQMPHHSAPRALELQSTTPSYLTFDVANVVGGKLEAQVQLVEDGTSGTNPVLASIAAPDGKRVAFEVLPGTSTGRCTFAGFTSSGPPFVDVPFARGAIWHAVSLKLSFSWNQNNNNVVLVNLLCFVDGGGHGLYDLTAGSNQGNVSFDVGVRGTTTDPMHAVFDNVVVMTQDKL